MWNLSENLLDDFTQLEDVRLSCRRRRRRCRIGAGGSTTIVVQLNEFCQDIPKSGHIVTLAIGLVSFVGLVRQVVVVVMMLMVVIIMKKVAVLNEFSIEIRTSGCCSN